MIDPRLPPSWDGYTMKRLYRGKEYDISVKDGKILVNGKLWGRATLGHSTSAIRLKK
jgi:cellobiose phosphorylase